MGKSKRRSMVQKSGFGKYQRTTFCVCCEAYDSGRRWSCSADWSFGFWLLVGSVHAHVGQCKHRMQLAGAVQIAGAAERRSWEVHHLHGWSPRTVEHPSSTCDCWSIGADRARAIAGTPSSASWLLRTSLGRE